MILLDFEEPLRQYLEQLDKAIEIGNSTDVDVSTTISELENKINSKRKEIYEGLTPCQRVQVSRHPERPYTLSYIDASKRTFPPETS